MRQNLDNLVVRPLFYDALSGEFQPSTDPERSHTLGKLVVATFIKGDFLMDTGEVASDIPYATFTYRPSWAPHVRAMIDCDLVDETSFRINGLDLRTQEGRSVYICDETDEEVSQLRIGTRQADDPYNLSLGAALSAARAAVTEAASLFFTPEQ